MRYALVVSITGSLWLGAIASAAADQKDHDIAALERRFRELPAGARRLTAPLVWLHGDADREQ